MVLIRAIAATFSPLILGFSLISFPLPTSGFPINQISLNFPSPPPGARNGPSRTVGSGVRGSGCVTQGVGISPFTALMPANNVATTLDANPTLFFYVPKTTARLGEIVVINEENKQEVYLKSDLPIPNNLANKPGIIKIKLNRANLIAGKSYSWSFSLICPPDSNGSNDSSQDPVTTGILERVTPASKNLPANTPVDPDGLNQGQIRNTAETYSSKGIWLEALEFARLLPHSQYFEWRELLHSVQLCPDIVNASVVN